MGVQFLILSLILRIDTSPFYRVITNVPQNYKFTVWDYQDSSVSSKCFCRIWKWDFLDHPFKRALLGSAVGLVVLLIILFGVWCIRRRELKRKKHLAILVSFFFTEPCCGIFHILYNVLLEGLVQKRVGTYSARVHNGNINGLLSTWKVLMEKKIYLLVGLIFMFLKNTCFSLFVRTNLLARLKLKNQLM